MTRNGRWAWALAAMAAMAIPATAQEQSKDKPEPSGNVKFMRAKLGHAQKLIEGLTLEDFDTVAKSAQEISLLTQAEVWQVFQTPEYVQHSQEFRRAADAVFDAARKKNIDAAALAYVDMTLKCVNCHKYVRTKRMASTKPLERFLAQQP